MRQGKGTEESNFNESYPLSASSQRIDRFFDRAATGTHHDDDSFRIRGAVIIEESIATAGCFGITLHRLFDSPGKES